MDESLAKHIITPSEFELETIIKRRKLYSEADKDLARDWVFTAKACRQKREYLKYLGNEDHAKTTEGAFDRAFMDFPAKLWQRLETRLGSQWFKDDKLKKQVWDMYPEFRIREKF